MELKLSKYQGLKDQFCWIFTFFHKKITGRKTVVDVQRNKWAKNESYKQSVYFQIHSNKLKNLKGVFYGLSKSKFSEKILILQNVNFSFFWILLGELVQHAVTGG